MPLVSAIADRTPFEDGRQSDRAMRVRHGVEMFLTDSGFASVPELVLANGRRADLTAVDQHGKIWIIEIKSSIEDLRADKKWADYTDYCDCFAFATLPDVPQELFPEDTGFIVADAYGADIILAPQEQPLNAARRKSMLITFGRAAASQWMAARWAATGLRSS